MQFCNSSSMRPIIIEKKRESRILVQAKVRKTIADIIDQFACEKEMSRSKMVEELLERVVDLLKGGHIK